MTIESDFEKRLVLIKRIVFLQLILIFVSTCLVFFATISNTQESEQFRVGLFWFCFLGGMFGANIALLRRVTKGKQLDAYLSNPSWTITLSPFLYGGILAGVAYFLMISGLVSGDDGGGLLTTNLFPKFAGGVVEDGQRLTMKHFRDLHPESTQDGAKAIVWCIIAGYSEGFVTGILSTLESRGAIGEEANPS